MPETWISEKALWDNIIYGEYCLKDTEALSVIGRIVKANARYDVVFYLPIEFPLIDDGLRSTNIEFQKAIDTSYIKYLKDNGIEYFILTGSVGDRLDQALDVIYKRCKIN
jgi:nicotinamide riboside kinase